MVERPPSNTASADFGEVDFGPVEVIVNGQRYVREETLFAALRELDDLREANRARDEQRAKADPNAAQRTEEPRRTSADDYAAFARGVRRHDRLTYHDEFARCPDCQHATVGLQPPYAINHGGACPSVAALPQRTEEPSEQRFTEKGAECRNTHVKGYTGPICSCPPLACFAMEHTEEPSE